MESVTTKPSRQIKLTIGEKSQLNLAVSNSGLTKKAFVDGVVIGFIQENNGKKVAFLKPSRSGKYHSVRLDEEVMSVIKQFAGDSDVSENAVLFTAIKTKLVNISNEKAVLDKAS